MIESKGVYNVESGFVQFLSQRKICIETEMCWIPAAPFFVPCQVISESFNYIIQGQGILRVKKHYSSIFQMAIHVFQEFFIVLDMFDDIFCKDKVKLFLHFYFRGISQNESSAWVLFFVRLEDYR